MTSYLLLKKLTLMFTNLVKRSPNAILRAARPLRMNQARCFVSAADLSSLQMKNDLYIKRAILDKQVEILNNDKIPSNLKNSDSYVYRHLGNSSHNI
jgi:ADP-glucose pyrophosphorylase